MSLTYTWRLVCLCCASFFVLHLALAVATRLSAGTAIRMAARMKPSSAARFLFFLRVSPMLLTGFALLAFCIPSYLWLEPQATGEKVGFICFLMAALGGIVWGPFHHPRRFGGSWDGTSISTSANVAGGRSRCRAIPPGGCCWLDQAPRAGGGGSGASPTGHLEAVFHGLTAEQREAALRHEQAHRTSRDNIKRFLILLSPDVLPFLRTFALEHSWAKFTEWAADDQATDGDSHRALSLASALVCVAKMGSKPKLSFLFSSLLDDDRS